MTVANVSQRQNSGSLPQELRMAQDAIHLPGVQEMLRRLAEYNLGIFMPHMHDEQTGQFQLLPEELIQVEAGLEVSFQSAETAEREADRFVPVGWFWRAGASTPLARCKMICELRPGDSMHYNKHSGQST